MSNAFVLRGDARNLSLPNESVDLLVTSPPYWSLRSYTDGGEHYAGQIGDEATPQEYIDNLLECTREWTRALKPGGSLWVNIGDKYAGAPSGPRETLHSTHVEQWRVRRRGHRADAPNKSLLGLPWRYALGCVTQMGLILRAEVLWSKPNGLPESARDRVRRSHEHWFHLVKQDRYFSAMDEIRDPIRNDPQHGVGLGATPGSVWEIATEPLDVPEHLGVDHYAAFPTALVRRIILGWSPSAICVECGEGRRPTTERVAGRVRKERGTSWNGGSLGLKGRVTR